MDDTSLIVEAKRGVFDHVLHIFRVMGDASGLYINEGSIKAVFIGSEPMLDDLKMLDWSWEEENNTTN